MLKKKDEALLRGFLNLYNIKYNSDNVEYTDNEEFIVYNDFIHDAYPEFNFNILISSKDINNINNETISKYHPFISISRNKPLISSNNINPFFITTTFYDPSFVELFSFKHGKNATWDNINSDLLIRNDDVESPIVLEKLIEEEKNKIKFQSDSKADYGKIEHLINKLYDPEGIIQGKLIKPFLENERINLFSKLKSPVMRILKQLYTEGIGSNSSNLTLTSSIFNNLNENYTFGLNDFKYEVFLDESNYFFFSQSCKNLYNQFYKVRSLKISETNYGGILNSIYIMIHHGRSSKRNILAQYTELFKYLGLIQENKEGELFFVLINPTDFINKLSAYFDIIKKGINQFKREFNYLKPLLNDSQLSDSDLDNINKILQIFKNYASKIGPDIQNIDKNLKEFCFPVLFFSLFLGFSKERDYFIVPCEITGEYHDKMAILTTPVAQRGGTIKNSNTMEKNLEILFEMVKINGSKDSGRKSLDLHYIEIISLKQKHDLLLEYGNYLKSTLQRIKETLNSYISEIKSSESSSIFVIKNFEDLLKEIENLKPKFASKNTLKPSLSRMNEIEEDSETIFREWKDLNIEYDEIFKKIVLFISQEVEIKNTKFSGCTDFNDKFENLNNEFNNQKNSLDQIKVKLGSISSYSLDSYKNEVESINKEYEQSSEKFEKLELSLNNYFEKEKKELELKQVILKRSNKFSVKNIRDNDIIANAFLQIDDKSCGDFLIDLNKKIHLIKTEGEYLTNNCWNAYYELMYKIEIEKIQDFTKRLQIKKILIKSIDQEDLKTLGDLNLIQMEKIIIYQI